MKIYTIYSQTDAGKMPIGSITLRDDMTITPRKTCPECKGNKTLSYSASHNPIGSVVCHVCRGEGVMEGDKNVV